MNNTEVHAIISVSRFGKKKKYNLKEKINFIQLKMKIDLMN